METTRLLASNPSLKEFINQWVPTLPQGELIKREHAERWYEVVMQQEPDRFAWHFGRLNGIGGSEIGEIAQRAMGYTATFNTVESIIAKKLMRFTPDKPDVFMRRGILAESMISKIFQEDYQATRQKKVMREIGSHKLGWMRGNVDDVVTINNSLGIIDYKASSEVPEDTSMIYQAQLQFYDYILADARGIRKPLEEIEKRTAPLVFDFMLNVYFDYQSAITKPIFVPYDGHLMRTMIEAGDAVWMHITQEEPLPQWHIKTQPTIELNLNDDEKTFLNERQEQILITQHALDLITLELDNLKKETVSMIYSRSGRSLIKQVESPLSCMNMTSRWTLKKEEWDTMLNGLQEDEKLQALEMTQVQGKLLDENKVIELLSNQSIDLSNIYQKEFDLEKVIEFCQSKNINPPINESTSLARGRSKDVKAKIEAINEVVTDDVKHFVQKLTSNSNSELLSSSLSPRI